MQWPSTILLGVVVVLVALIIYYALMCSESKVSPLGAKMQPSSMDNSQPSSVDSPEGYEYDYSITRSPNFIPWHSYGTTSDYLRYHGRYLQLPRGMPAPSQYGRNISGFTIKWGGIMPMPTGRRVMPKFEPNPSRR